MTSLSGISNGSGANAMLLGCRLLLAGLFVHEGFFLLAHFDLAAASMKTLGVAPILLVPTIALQIIAGLAILLGWQTRWGSLSLGVFCLATAILFHADWASRNDLLHFEKDLAIAGGLFVLMLQGGGAWSVEGILRRRGAPDQRVGARPAEEAKEA